MLRAARIAAAINNAPRRKSVISVAYHIRVLFATLKSE
jgi:hypothetical protein